jgi:lysophospholipase L1-like esterase
MKKLLYTSLFFNLIFFACIIFALIKIGSPRYLFYLAMYRGNGIVSLKKHKTSHLETLPKKEGKIVMLGNSITAECEWSELLDNQQIINRGVIGDGTADILARLGDVIAMKPKQVFLLIGVNDLQFIPLSKILENYEKIVLRIKSETPSTELFLISILPIHNSLRRTGMRNEDIDFLNRGIAETSKKFGLKYIDVASKLKNLTSEQAGTEGVLREDLSLDGIHLNGQGYLIFKDAILPYLD